MFGHITIMKGCLYNLDLSFSAFFSFVSVVILLTHQTWHCANLGMINSMWCSTFAALDERMC